MRLVIATWIAATLWWFAAPPIAAQTPVRIVPLLPADSVASLVWISLASDPQGDGLRPPLPDAKELFYAIDAATDLIWFKVTLYGAVPERWFGMNVAFETDENPNNGRAWWGTNKFNFDRLGTAYLQKTGDDWHGYAGVSDNTVRGSMNNVTMDVRVAVDREHPAILLGIPRAAIGAMRTVRVIATVGSMMANNDDVPNEGSVVVTLRP
jgi:hypothetical protein